MVFLNPNLLLVRPSLLPHLIRQVLLSRTCSVHESGLIVTLFFHLGYRIKAHEALHPLHIYPGLASAQLQEATGGDMEVEAGPVHSGAARQC
jgi:hypothetical protein